MGTGIEYNIGICQRQILISSGFFARDFLEDIQCIQLIWTSVRYVIQGHMENGSLQEKIGICTRSEKYIKCWFVWKETHYVKRKFFNWRELLMEFFNVRSWESCRVFSLMTMARNVRNVLMKLVDDPSFRDTLNREENKTVNTNWMILR